MEFDELFRKLAIAEGEWIQTLEDVREAINSQFKSKPELPDLNSPEGAAGLLQLATHPFFSRASVGIDYSALNGAWHVSIGSKVEVETAGADFSMALGVALLAYHDKIVPERAEKRCNITRHR